jgi:zinc protease
MVDQGAMLTALAALWLTASPPVSIPFERYTLPNGLTVILHEDHRLPSVTVNLWYRVGSADEVKGRTGFAHLFEHLMFMGTAAVPNGDFDKTMEQAGGTNNATTSEDRTNYFESGPSNLLETFLFLEADRMAHLADDMTKAKVDLQREVVKNERRQSYENRPYGLTNQLLLVHLFPAGHPYQHPVIGSHADLSAASVDDVKAFFRTHYVPSNASMVIAGDFVPTEAKKLVEKYFAALPRVEAPMRPIPPMVALAKPARVTQKDKVQAERVVLAWLTPPEWSKGEPELDLLTFVLADGKSSRLVQSLVLEQQLASSVTATYSPQRGPGTFVITATAQGTHTAAELEKALEAQLERLRTSPPTAEEVDRARALLQVEQLSNLEMVFLRADLLNALETQLGDPGLLPYAVTTRYEQVGPSEVAEVVRRIFSKPRVTLTFIPETKKKVGAK